MKQERGKCDACGHKTVVRNGEAADGRPQYKCLNGNCNETHTVGHNGHDWDTQPAPTRSS